MQPEPPAGAPPPQPARLFRQPAPPARCPVVAAVRRQPRSGPPPHPSPPLQFASARPGVITAASIILIIFGVILGLLGLLVMLGGALFPAIKDSPELAGQLGAVPESFGTFILVSARS